MSCDAQTRTILACIQAVCAASRAHVGDINQVRAASRELEAALVNAQASLACVLTGAAETSCGGLPTLAGALSAVSADSIAGIAVDTATATAGQTMWTLGAAPASIQHLDVAVNGAHLRPSADYTLSGANVTFTHALAAGDVLTAWRYSV